MRGDVLPGVEPSPPAPIWHLAAASWFPLHRRAGVVRRMHHLPMAMILLAQAALTWRLQNSAFQDEALYLNGGRDLVRSWLHGTPSGNPGDFFSGAPAAYPVIAAGLDSVGGLWLARSFSLVCMLGTTVLLAGTTRTLYGPRAGLLASAALVTTGPVIFLGGFATFDAACLASLAVALWIGVTRRPGAWSVLGTGLALAVAATMKYAGAGFIPLVILVVFLAQGAGRRALGRALLTAVVPVVLIAVALLLWGTGVGSGIAFTTTARQALFPTTSWNLTGFLVLDLGLLLLLAVVGCFLVPRRPRPLLLAAALMAAAAALPVSQYRLGELVSFEKHLAYAALFLAPLAGLALAALSLRGARMLGVFALLFVMLLGGLSRSLAMFTMWPDVSRVVEIVSDDARTGRYLSTSSDALLYYTRDVIPQAEWESQYALIGAGHEAVRAAVADDAFQYVIFRSGTSGNVTEDQAIAVLRAALDASPDYSLVVPPFATREYATESWYVYRLK